LAAAVLVPCWSGAVDTVTVGEGGKLDWHGQGRALVATLDAQHRSPLDPNKLQVSNAPGDLVEFASSDFPGAILPLRIKEGENIAGGTMTRGGSIDAPNVFDFGWTVGVASSGIFDRNDLRLALEELLTTESGGATQAFERKNYNSMGTLVILNLGGRFGVNRIRFYPRNTVQKSPTTPYQQDFLRAFELYVSGGAEGQSIVWEPLRLETDNQNPVVDVPISPPRYVQNMRLRATSTVNFELDEIEIYGVGFLARAHYISDIFDAGQPAIWGKLGWTEETIGQPAFSGLEIRTRTGSDNTPFVFTRMLSGKRDAEEIPVSLQDPTREMEQAEYQTLPQTDASDLTWDPGPVRDDLVDWSPFSTPYLASAANAPGLEILSPSPRRYFQFQVTFRSDALEATRVVKSLSFELLSPPFADQILGEIYPRQVEVASPTSFTYAVRPVMKTAGLRGFDTMEIYTPIQVESIDGIQILDSTGQLIAQQVFAGIEDTSVKTGFQIVSVAQDKFVVRFPFVRGDRLVKVRFRTKVLTYSTTFSAAVRLASEKGIAQAVFSGDAATLADDDDPDLSATTVLSPSVLHKGRLLQQVGVAPAVFTPNGDGVNDAAVFRYSLLSLDVPRPVKIGVHDLGGRLVRLVHDGPELNGQYEDKSWDGRDAAGRVVPPGLYIVRIAVEGDAQQDEQVRVVGVAY
jgi:hypothetical protein